MLTEGFLTLAASAWDNKILKFGACCKLEIVG